MTIQELLAIGRREYVLSNRSSIRTFDLRAKHVARLFSSVPPSGAEIEAFKNSRISEGAAPATVNAELSALSLGLRLARYQGLIDSYVPPRRLHVANARSGFVTDELFARLHTALSVLDPHVADLISWLFETGWRVSEAQGLLWSDVHLEARTLTLPWSKNGSARTIGLAGAPLAILERRASVRNGPYVFSRRKGSPIRNFRDLWRRAIGAIGRPDLLVHDLRRSFARRATLAGVPQSVQIIMAGWKSATVYRRYSIIDEEQVASAFRRLSGRGIPC